MSATSENNTWNLTAVPGTQIQNGDIIRVMQIVFYSLILSVGAIGNTLICFAILGRTKRKISEYFILNLAITDLAVSIISIPLDITENLSGYWPFGKALCKIVYPLQTILMAVSVNTLLAMSLERHRAIMYPLKPRIKSEKSLIIIAVVWAGSIALVIPYIHVLSYKDDSCIENWPGPVYAKAYTMSVFIVLYLLPLLVISAAYVHVGYKLCNDIDKLKNVLVGSANGELMYQHRVHRNVRIVKIFVAAVTAFAICFLPTHVVWIWYDYGTGSSSPNFSTILVFANILVYANSCINPFIFGTLQSRFGASCMAIFRKTVDKQTMAAKLHKKKTLYSLRVSFTSSSKFYSSTHRNSVMGPLRMGTRYSKDRGSPALEGSETKRQCARTAYESNV